MSLVMAMVHESDDDGGSERGEEAVHPSNTLCLSSNYHFLMRVVGNSDSRQRVRMQSVIVERKKAWERRSEQRRNKRRRRTIGVNFLFVSAHECGSMQRETHWRK